MPHNTRRFSDLIIPPSLLLNPHMTWRLICCAIVENVPVVVIQDPKGSWLPGGGLREEKPDYYRSLSNELLGPKTQTSQQFYSSMDRCV